MSDLHLLPQVKDRICFWYVEHARIEQEKHAIKVSQEKIEYFVPIMTINTMLLGPGTSITHSAIKTISESGCLIIWTGTNMESIYSTGCVSTNSSKNILAQAEYLFDKKKHLDVARKMYQLRYVDMDIKNKSIEQLRGMEGLRMRSLYEALSTKYNINWTGRDYKMNNWDAQTEINKAISISNNMLYNICYGVIVSMGFSPSLGFIHTGKSLSFVYDIADLYKEKISVPLAFEVVSQFGEINKSCEKELRKRCREKVVETKMMKQIPKDLKFLFSSQEHELELPESIVLWDPKLGYVDGQKNYSTEYKNGKNP